ncbi:TolC family protein [Gemmata sp. JC673]|uniref:TolC family protein n=1 Tax=Gemmata algarum TaxID=2975278 RepID=A0ABU5F7G0_9BACT|nr:TolC family protein [Gemmata algarum]MDY3561809.1 TolC family protein [Gemmata algarum]
MRVFNVRTAWRAVVCTGGATALAVGCASPDRDDALLLARPPAPAKVTGRSSPVTPAAGRTQSVHTGVQQAAFRDPAPSGTPGATALSAPSALDDFVRLAVEQNPRLSKANLAIDAARGRHLQAGLYPNPDVAVNWDELGDRSSPDRLGILTAPRVSQTIVTGRKLTLAQAVAAREVDQAALELLGERFAVVGSVRGAFYEAFTLQQRAEILAEVVKLAEDAAAVGKTLLDNKQIARLDLIQLEVERERFRAELQSVRRELPGAYRRLAAVAGQNGLIPAAVKATFDNLPNYDPEATRQAVLEYHPQARSARVGVERAQAAVRRAEVEPIPNLTVSAGYIRQFENRSHDGAVGVSLPVPLWNRNQGNIRAARAELGMAIQNVGQTENELAARVAAAYQAYAAARERAEAYRKELIPRAEETYQLSLTAFKGGQFEYLRVIQAQRAVAEARLEYNRSIGEAWKSAAELSGLLMEELWPVPISAPAPAPASAPAPIPAPAAPPKPGAGPVVLPSDVSKFP